MHFSILFIILRKHLFYFKDIFILSIIITYYFHCLKEKKKILKKMYVKLVLHMVCIHCIVQPTLLKSKNRIWYNTTYAKHQLLQIPTITYFNLFHFFHSHNPFGECLLCFKLLLFFLKENFTHFK